ncbi:MAG: arylsulfotransferase family protein, partial [Actinomycetota bacterium]|nr:arylsulfotransferase family protein [Actinomycetota bacterium]
MKRPGRLAAVLTIVSCAVAIGCGGSDEKSNDLVSAYPSPGTEVASPQTTISFVGMDADDPGTVTVTGSKSGEHSGTFEAFAAVDGAAFVPDEPFVAEETVTVATDHEIAGADNGEYEFRTATFRTDAAPPPRNLPKEGKLRIEEQSFKSRPDLKPPVVDVDVPADERAADGDFFLSPKADGPMIVGPEGDLVYFRPDVETADFRTQTYKDQPVLTWWEGPFNAGGYTEGTFVIAGQDYREIQRVRMGNSYKGDLHEFKLTDRGTAYVPAYRTVLTDLSPMGGPKRGAVLDSVAQEIDLETGHVLWEWHSMGNVDLDETEIAVPQSPTEA